MAARAHEVRARVYLRSSELDMAKRNLDTTGSDNSKTPERRRRITTDTPGKTAAAPRARGRRKTDPSPAVASAAEMPPVSIEPPAPITAEPAIEAPVSVGATAGNGSATDPGNGHGADVRISHEDIALRAYHLYLERGGRAGDQVQDWVTAERQLRERTLGQ
jgi:hypothetical protein